MAGFYARRCGAGPRSTSRCGALGAVRPRRARRSAGLLPSRPGRTITATYVVTGGGRRHRDIRLAGRSRPGAVLHGRPPVVRYLRPWWARCGHRRTPADRGGRAGAPGDRAARREASWSAAAPAARLADGQHPRRPARREAAPPPWPRLAGAGSSRSSWRPCRRGRPSPRRAGTRGARGCRRAPPGRGELGERHLVPPPAPEQRHGVDGRSRRRQGSSSRRTRTARTRRWAGARFRRTPRPSARMSARLGRPTSEQRVPVGDVEGDHGPGRPAPAGSPRGGCARRRPAGGRRRTGRPRRDGRGRAGSRGGVRLVGPMRQR